MTDFRASTWRKLVAIILTAVICVTGIISLTEPVQANPISELLRRIRLIVNPPPKAQTTGRTSGNAGRGGRCPSVDIPLTALALSREETLVSQWKGKTREIKVKSVGGLTSNQNPSFWFYIPYRSQSVTSAKFMLLDQNLNPVLKNDQPLTIRLVKTPGVIQVPLSSTDLITDLIEQKTYNWYFSIVCDSRRPSRNPSVRGWVQFVKRDDLDQALQRAPKSQRYLVYLENGIWYDGFTNLIDQCRNSPREFRNLWNDVLKDLQLEKLADQPPEQLIVNCRRSPE